MNNCQQSVEHLTIGNSYAPINQMSDCSDKPKCDKGRRIAIVVLYILIAVLYGWVSYICYCDLNFDANNSAGIFISVLGILVAILMGWQVVNAITNTKTLRRIYTLKKELTVYREQARQDAVNGNNRYKICEADWKILCKMSTD